MSTQPTVSVPAGFSDAARAIVAARRPCWQYELLGQILCDAVEEAATMDPPGPVSMPAETSFPSFGSYCLELVERLASNLESMNPAIAEEVTQIANGGMHAFGKVASSMTETYLQARQLAHEIARLPTRSADLTPRPAWRRELEGYMVKVKEDLCDMAAQSLLIHESIGESIMARVRSAQKRTQAGEPCVLDLNLRFCFESSTFNEHLQQFIDCLDMMSRVLDAKIGITKTSLQHGTPQPGRICLYQSLFDADLVAVTVRCDGEESAALTVPWKMLRSYACIREARVYDVRRAEACVRSLLEPHHTTGVPVTYQLPVAEASELVRRVAQLYALPSMS
ncbi:hypothetical protein [Noviherbaspirillum galbum]|uniref:Uncharacterized protein n=1 Tax=Noviherbaspirillum galbum TaxID=2709383 RepID=A0A6B3SM78_9BURK|nr:hypothetical protein [Noviherbaspirillum galbum]NEX61930.1 hypothetical protein [Noviherbaspirillum galbum]